MNSIWISYIYYHIQVRTDHETYNGTHFKEFIEREKDTCVGLRKLVQKESVEWTSPTFKGCLVHVHRHLHSCVMHRSCDHMHVDHTGMRALGGYVTV